MDAGGLSLREKLGGIVKADEMGTLGSGEEVGVTATVRLEEGGGLYGNGVEDFVV